MTLEEYKKKVKMCKKVQNKDDEEDFKFKKIKFLDEEYNKIKIERNNYASNKFYILDNINKVELLLSSLNRRKMITINSSYGSFFSYCFCITVLNDFANKTIIDNVIIVDSLENLFYVDQCFQNKIILVKLNFSIEETFLNFKNIYIFFDSALSQNDFLLRNISSQDFETELSNYGFTLEEAKKLAHIAGYNPLSLRRLLSNNPLIQKPIWSYNENKQKLIPLLLLGIIDFSNYDEIFLKSLNIANIDDFIQNLNAFLEIEDSPIFNDGEVYKFNSRKEGYDFIKINLSLESLKFLEEYIILQLTGVEYFENQDERLIKNILDGFILLSDKSKINKIHFDDFCIKIFKKLLEQDDNDLIYYSSYYFYKLGELSEKNYLEFITKLIKKHKSIFEDEILDNIYEGLFSGLKNEKTCLKGINVFIDLFYEWQSDETFDMLAKYFSKVFYIDSNSIINFANKIDFLLCILSDTNIDKKRIILKGIYKRDLYYLENYKKVFNIKDENVLKELNEDYLKIYKSIYNISTDYEKIELLKDTLNNIFEEKMIFKYFSLEIDLLIAELNKKDDSIKDKLLNVILMFKKKISCNSNKYYKTIGNFFDKKIEQIKINDLYLKYKNYLLNDEFCINDEKDEILKESVLKELIKNDKENVFKLINDISEDNVNILDLLYNLYGDHLELMSYIIQKENEVCFKSLIKYFNDKELLKLLQTYSNNKFLIKNILFRPVIYKNINLSGNLERIFWMNHKLENFNNEDFEYLFQKYLIFNPAYLVSYFENNIYELNVEYSIKILKGIEVIYQNDQEARELFYAVGLKKILDKIDKFNCDEKFFPYEISLLPFSNRIYEIYPLVIQRVFARNPETFIKYIYELYIKSKDNNLNFGERRIYISCSSKKRFKLLNFEIIESENNVNAWVGRILRYDYGDDVEFRNLMLKVILKIISKYNSKEEYIAWPSENVCKIIDALCEEDFNVDIENEFLIAFKTNKIIGIKDKEKNLNLSKKFNEYSFFYRYRYVYISKILGEISEYFLKISKSGRK